MIVTHDQAVLCPSFPCQLYLIICSNRFVSAAGADAFGGGAPDLLTPLSCCIFSAKQKHGRLLIQLEPPDPAVLASKVTGVRAVPSDTRVAGVTSTATPAAQVDEPLTAWERQPSEQPAAHGAGAAARDFDSKPSLGSDGGQATSAAAGQKVRRRGGLQVDPKPNIWLTPWLLGYRGGRVLRPTCETSLSRLMVAQELALVSFGCEIGVREVQPVTVELKVPQGAVHLLSGADQLPEDSPGVAAGCWPGVVLSVVQRFQSEFTTRVQRNKNSWGLTRLGSSMRSALGWRLFAYEVVS